MSSLIIFVKEHFFTKTKADWKSAKISSKKWKKMIADTANAHWHAPLPSLSEYILTKEEGKFIIYRMSTSWGVAHSNKTTCQWTLNGEKINLEKPVIACATLDSFKRI